MYVDLSLFSVLNIKTLADTNEMHWNHIYTLLQPVHLLFSKYRYQIKIDTTTKMLLISAALMGSHCSAAERLDEKTVQIQWKWFILTPIPNESKDYNNLWPSVSELYRMHFNIVRIHLLWKILSSYCVHPSSHCHCIYIL